MCYLLTDLPTKMLYQLNSINYNSPAQQTLDLQSLILKFNAVRFLRRRSVWT